MQQQKTKSISKQDVAEEAEEIPEVTKRDLTDTDALLDEIDELLDEDTIAEAIAKKEFKEKLQSIQFPRPRREVPVTLEVTTVITCEFRCENCTCGR